MTKSLVLNQVTPYADGSIGVRWLKQIADPATGAVTFSEPHRTTIPADGDIDQQIEAVSAHLQAMGYPAVDAAMLARIKAVKAVGAT